ncbi:hypothetical protein Aco03nite_093510 [Actinoplanes couchii]|uniref:Tetratricopeptide repeat protein n=2 Tax=Actinoplanes couchii TaxID=403638 RepID=A0ABQ3XR00_9ACTN|nr:hypothetical protein Aco03nite_093510 [Actinoplanes couchii]
MSDMTDKQPDEILAAMGAAVELGRDGDRPGARDALTRLWERASVDGDAMHRCSIAHYLADLQDSPADELMWDERALAAVTDLDDERVRRVHDSMRVRAFLPSLHLNLADVHRRLGNIGEAREHLAAATKEVDALPDDDYGSMMLGALDRVREALDSGPQDVDQ